MADPQVTMGFNTKMMAFWMIWGTPILGNFHLGVSEKPFTTHQMAEEGKL